MKVRDLPDRGGNIFGSLYFSKRALEKGILYHLFSDWNPIELGLLFEGRID